MNLHNLQNEYVHKNFKIFINNFKFLTSKIFKNSSFNLYYIIHRKNFINIQRKFIIFFVYIKLDVNKNTYKLDKHIEIKIL